VQPSVAPEAAEAAPVAPPPAPSRPQFGLDLGSATTVEGLRLLWTNAKSKHGTALEGLRPVMTVRDHARPGGVELRLIAGPVPNAAAAARLCAAMAGTVCQPAVYEGQRLALR
jgi:biotin carboxyl carrier protein